MRTSWFSIATLTMCACTTAKMNRPGTSQSAQAPEASCACAPSHPVGRIALPQKPYDYLRHMSNSGHPGSVTSVHAASAELAFEQLVLLVKQSDEGADCRRMDDQKPVVPARVCLIQCGVECHRRFISEICTPRNVVMRGIELARAQRRRLARMLTGSHSMRGGPGLAFAYSLVQIPMFLALARGGPPR